jgi:flavin reductase (DIM6/NTAB) family NADH-FMN oxidoreductase RutF
MKKISITPQPIILPSPVLIIGTYNEDGTPNIMNAAWGGVASSRPPAITVSLREATKSYHNIKNNQSFTVNIPSVEYVQEADYVGIVSGKERDKFKDCNLTPIKSEIINAPIVLEFPYALECKLIKMVELGLHTMFIGEVVGLVANEDILGERGMPDIEKVMPIIFGSIGSKSYYSIGSKLQEAYNKNGKYNR